MQKKHLAEKDVMQPMPVTSPEKCRVHQKGRGFKIMTRKELEKKVLEVVAAAMEENLEAVAEEIENASDTELMQYIAEQEEHAEFIEKEREEKAMATIKNVKTGETITREFTKSQLEECKRDGFAVETIPDSKMAIIASYMDDDLRETVHAELAPCTNTEFLKRYVELDIGFDGFLRNQFDIEL